MKLKTKECGIMTLEFKIVNILYTCNTAHFSLKLRGFFKTG